MQSGPSGQQYDPIKKTSEHRGQWAGFGRQVPGDGIGGKERERG